jgi:hypothetical protein
LDVKEKPTEELTETVEIEEDVDEDEQIEAEVRYIFHIALILQFLDDVTSSSA